MYLTCIYLKKKLAQPENFLIWRGFNLAQPEKKIWRGFQANCANCAKFSPCEILFELRY